MHWMTEFKVSKTYLHIQVPLDQWELHFFELMQMQQQKGIMQVYEENSIEVDWKVCVSFS